MSQVTNSLSHVLSALAGQAAYGANVGGPGLERRKNTPFAAGSLRCFQCGPKPDCPSNLVGSD